MPDNDFLDELVSLLNRHCIENRSNTPDFILAEYLMDCLRSWEVAVVKRGDWYGKHMSIGQAEPLDGCTSACSEHHTFEPPCEQAIHNDGEVRG